MPAARFREKLKQRHGAGADEEQLRHLCESEVFEPRRGILVAATPHDAGAQDDRRDLIRGRDDRFRRALGHRVGVALLVRQPGDRDVDQSTYAVALHPGHEVFHATDVHSFPGLRCCGALDANSVDDQVRSTNGPIDRQHGVLEFPCMPLGVAHRVVVAARATIAQVALLVAWCGDLVARLAQRLNTVPADEARATEDDDTHIWYRGCGRGDQHGAARRWR